ncbi:wax ester/triacylglycerol synthase domain-containing protein [Streptacidiphilus albus]|uniref:wax ester/triacylglycerol synthase domain-containing protein n=1 Tax=Streptacidiphilus albus TaxID=105425 RepID=UPI000AF55E88|nr:wax ester/triacylglycerol synthase domain-containing protein [Streptacidiphilus albus]
MTTTTAELRPLDMAFWSLESEAAPLHLGALLHFGPGGAPDAESLVSLLAERAGRSARLRQRVHVPWNPLDPPRWVDDPRFAARQHIGVHPLEGPGALERVTAALMAAPLRRELPPWEIHLLTGGGLAQGFTLLLKVHHAAVDGLRAVELGVRLLDRLEADRQPAPEPPPSRHPGLAAGLAAGLDGFTRRTLRSARVAAEVATAVVGSRVAEGWRPVGTPLHTGATGTTGAVAGERVLALPSLATRDLQLIRRAHGGTLHDIVLAVVAGGLRRWFLDLGRDPALRSTRVLVPVSQRARTEDAEQGNQLSGFLVTLPLAEPDPLIRLYRVREAMSAHKARGPLRGPGAVATLPDLLPPGVQRFTGPLLRPSAPLLFDALVTDVPLPGLRFTLAGAPLTAMNPLPPLAQGHTLAIAASRYRDRVHLGIHGEADPDRDPRDLSAMLAAEVRTLLQLS